MKDALEIRYERIFLISDIHFGVRGNSLEWVHNQLQFFKEFYIPFLKENVKDGDVLFVLGDWFDNRQLLDILVMNVSKDIVTEMAQILPVYFITGNHDIYKKKDTDVHSLSVFSDVYNVTVYEKPLVITNGKSKILVMPWVGDSNEEEEIAKNNPADYIFAHTDVHGFKYDNGMQIVRGTNLLDLKFKRVISGHIHKRQEIREGRGIYIGSPYHTKRSDIGNNKGVYIFHPNDNRMEFFENTLSSIYQRVRLEDLMESTLGEVKKLLENNYTDIIVPDRFVHLFNLTRFIDLIKGCEYMAIETKGEKVKIEDSLSGFMEGENIKDILTLLENSLEDTFHSPATVEVLKERNRGYYVQASDELEIEDLKN